MYTKWWVSLCSKISVSVNSHGVYTLLSNCLTPNPFLIHNNIKSCH